MDTVTDLEKRPEPGGEGCLVVAIRLPVRILALVLVVPVRLAWDALAAGGRLLYEKVLVPLGRGLGVLLWAVFVWPLLMLWRYVLAPVGRTLRWLGRMLIVVPAVWLYEQVLTPLGHAIAWLARGVGVGIAWLARGVGVGLGWLAKALFVWPWVWAYVHLLTPVGHAIAWLAKGVGGGIAWLARGVGVGIAWLVRMLVVVPCAWAYANVLAPLGRALALAVSALVRWILVAPALALWRWVLVPVGRALGVVLREIGTAFGHAWRIAGHVSLAVGRFIGRLLRLVFVDPVRWAYRAVLTPLGHVVRDQVWRPALHVAREVRASLRQARADVRRALFGTTSPAEPQVRDRREPGAPQPRTLGSSTTASTKTAFIKD
ncbi:hypothetical protein ACIBUY_09205 [Streptomyces sp. NPDC050085]|uniref:hypothetical protein n=1 Tax=Streptomyces sp. NPDC050085 TaxID=3365600 RepID=UPI0037A70C31